MILSFEFNYISENALLENFLENICKDFDIEYKIGKEKSIIKLEVKGSEEKLEEFSDFISQRLPLSIFFKSSAVNVVDKFSIENFDVQNCNLTLPFTPKTLQSDNPLLNNEIGNELYANDSSVILYEDGAKINYNSFDELYEKIADIFSSGKEVSIQSASGSYIYGILDKTFASKNYKDYIVFPTDLSRLEKMVVIRENEIKALASLEKPAIKLKVNSLYEAKEILPISRVKVKLADEILIFKILQKLHEKGIDFVYRVNANKNEYILKIEGILNNIPQIEVTVLENGEILILSGSDYASKELKENLKKFDNPAYASFASVMQEHDIFDKKVSCFYLSMKNDDLIMHLSEKTGMLNLITFPVLKSFKEIFETMEKSNSGKKLLKNYKDSYPQIFDKIEDMAIPENLTDSIYSVWKIVSVILGLSDDLDCGADKIIEFAEDFGGLKGPMIDYKVIEEGKLVSQFDMVKLIRSAMSFRLAGTDDKTLSFGLLESLAYFLSDTSDFCRDNLSSERLALCGSMFGVRRLSELTCKQIQANMQICMNKELPIEN
jgi:hypothetical protein